MMERCVDSVSLSGGDWVASAAEMPDAGSDDEDDEDNTEAEVENGDWHAVGGGAFGSRPLIESDDWVSAASHAIDTLVVAVAVATAPAPPMPNRPAARGKAAIGAKCAKRSRTDEKPSGCALKRTCQIKRTARMAPMPCVHTFIDSLCSRKMEATHARIV